MENDSLNKISQQYTQDKNLTDITFFFFSWRLALVVLGIYAFYRLPTSISLSSTLNNFWDIWLRYDSNWYIDIAQKGYFSVQSTAFFPLWPILIAILGYFFFFLSSKIIAIVFSTILAFLASLILYELIKLNFSREIAKKTVIYFLIFPTAFFLAIGYTEALFIFLCLLCFYFAKKNNWFWAGLVGLLLSLTRAIGIFIIIPLLVEYLNQKKFILSKVKADIFFLFFIPMGLVMYLIYLKYSFGNIFIFLQAQDNWARTMFSSGIFGEIYRDFITLLNPRNFISDDYSASLMRLASYFIPIFSFIYLWYKKYYSYALFIFLGIMIPLSTGTSASFYRYLVVLFPIYLVLAILAQNKFFYYLSMMIFIMIQSLFIALFVNGYWVA